MRKNIVKSFGGLNKRTLKGSLERLEFQQLQNAKLERNGNLRGVKVHDFVHESTNRNEGIYVEEDGTVRELTFDSGKTYTNKPTFVKLSKREVLYNDPADDISKLPKILVDGNDQADTIKNSTFPSYGIPYNENSKIIPDNSGNFYVVELNLEIDQRLGGRKQNDSQTFTYNCFDTKIVLSVRKFNGTDFKSSINKKISHPTIGQDNKVYVAPKTSGKSKYQKNCSFPLFWLSGEENTSTSFVQQYLNWDVCLNSAQDTLVVACNSMSHMFYYTAYGNSNRYNKVQEVTKIIPIDVSGDIIADSDPYTVVNTESSNVIYPTESAKFKSGFGIAHNGTYLYVKGIRWSYRMDIDDGSIQNTVDSVLEIGDGTLTSRSTSIYAYSPLLGFYAVGTNLESLGQLIDLTATFTPDVGDVLVTKHADVANVVYLYSKNEGGVYPLSLSSGAVGALDTSANSFPLYYTTGWIKYNDPIVTGNEDYLINQTSISNEEYNGFSFILDDIHFFLDTTEGAHTSFKDLFTVRDNEDGTSYGFDFKKVFFLAVGVRFNDNLYTPPINYAMMLLKPDESTTINWAVFTSEILSKASSSNSFDDVNEIFLFANDQDSVDDYYSSSKTQKVGTTSLKFSGVGDINYGDIMGINHSDGFNIYYRAIANIGGRTFAVGAKTDSQTLDTLSQILYYTDGHPSGLNPQSDYIFLSDIINPVIVVGVQQKCLIIGEDDIGFAFNTIENIHKAKGTINFNAVASNGDVAFYLHREGVMMADQYRVVNISETVIDPDIFRSMSDSEFKDCSGAIHGEYGLYILSDPTNKKIYCFDISSCYSAFGGGSKPFVFETKFDLTGTANYTAFTGVHKLQTFYNKVYGKCFVTAGGVDGWMTVELFKEDSGEASHQCDDIATGTSVTETYPFDNRNQVIVRSSELKLATRPKSLEIHYKSNAELTIDSYKTYLGTEANENSGTLPISTSLSTRKKQWLKNMKNDHFSFKIQGYPSDFELEQIDINE